MTNTIAGWILDSMFAKALPAVALALGGLFSFFVLGNLIHSTDASPVLASGWSVREATDFQEFSIYWLGEDFGGLPLKQIIRYEYAGDATNTIYPTSEDFVAFEYGDCQIPPGAEGGCALPLVVEIDPYCDVPPERISDGVTAAGLTTLGGAQVQWFKDGHVRVWTGDVSIGIFATDSRIVEEAANHLVRLNGDAQSQPQDDLGPPTVMRCPEREWHWKNPPPGQPQPGLP